MALNVIWQAGPFIKDNAKSDSVGNSPLSIIILGQIAFMFYFCSVLIKGFESSSLT